MCTSTRLPLADPTPSRIRYRKGLHRIFAPLLAPAMQQWGFEVKVGLGNYPANLPDHHPRIAHKFQGMCERSREEVRLALGTSETSVRVVRFSSTRNDFHSQRGHFTMYSNSVAKLDQSDLSK
jgi:hypothetical protein